MPSYYQSHKFKNKLAEQKRERAAHQEKLRREIANRPKRQLNEICLQIGKEIRRLRLRMGMSQVKLAGLVGTSQAAIGRIESGRHNPTVKNIEKIAKIFGGKLKMEIE